MLNTTVDLPRGLLEPDDLVLSFNASGHWFIRLHDIDRELTTRSV